MKYEKRSLLKHIVSLVANGSSQRSIMFYGPPGVGKSKLIRSILKVQGFSEENANLLYIDGYITVRGFLEYLEVFLEEEAANRVNFLVLDDTNLTSSSKPKELAIFKSLLNSDIDTLNYLVSGRFFQIDIKNLKTVIVFNKSKVNKNIHFQAMESRSFTVTYDPNQTEILENAKDIFVYQVGDEKKRSRNKRLLKDIETFVNIHGGPRVDLRLIKQCLDIHVPNSSYVENYLYEKLGPKAEIKKSIIESLADNSLPTMDKKAKSVSQKHGISVRSFYLIKKQISDAINKVL